MKKIVDLRSGLNRIIGRSENTTRFFRDINKFPTLTREEEVDLFRQLRTGTPSERKAAREKLINCNQRIVYACAKKWGNEDDVLDYTNEANFGLIEAIETFDETKGNKFSSYALYFIKRAIVRYNQGTALTIKTSNAPKVMNLKAKAISKFEQTYHHSPTVEELADFMNTTLGRDIKDKRDLMDIKFTYVDADDTTANKEESHGRNEMVEFHEASCSKNDIENKMTVDFHKKLVRSIMKALNPRDKKVIEMRYGIREDGGFCREMDFKEIADTMHMTPERVRQIEAKIRKKMKVLFKERLKFAFSD